MKTLDERIGEAWRLYRASDTLSAIDLFKQIIAEAPDSVDGYYGLGLAQRGNGDTAGAASSFQQALKLARTALEAYTRQEEESGHHVNALNSYDDDRMMMLIRMIGQRLVEVGASPLN
jgi:tetratricopeptide (TPR) repeat protein